MTDRLPADRPADLAGAPLGFPIPWGETPDPRPVERAPAAAVRVRKFDGSLHFEFEARVLRYDQGERLVLAVPQASPVVHHGRGLCFREPGWTVGTLWSRHWWNFFAGYGPDGRLRWRYANVCLPGFVYQAGVITWVDLELDVVARGDGPPEIRDADEFAAARRRWEYSDRVVDGAWKAARDAFLRLQDPEFLAPYATLDRVLREAGGPPAGAGAGR